MKKVLFIYYHFPPIMGDWRGLGIGALLPEFGWQPVVISAAESVKYDKDYSLLGKVPKEFEIHPVGHREPSALWQVARCKLRINYDFPDYYKNWYTPVLREAREILKKEKIDLIFSSSPPYTSALIAMKLKKEFGIPWVADWRDLWSANDFLNLSYDKTLIKPLRNILKYRIRKAEQDVLVRADKNIAVSWYQRQRLIELYDIEENKIEVITNGYDESDFTGLKPYNLYAGKLTIVFIGSFYPDYQEPIQKFFKVISQIAKDIEVVFVGRGAADVRGVSLPNLTRILHMPRERALSFASGSDFLFLIMPSYARWIPGKIFEYLRLGKPILALVPEDSDPARIIKEAGAGFVLSFEEEKMREQLKVIFEQWREGKLRNFQPVKEYVSQFEHRNLTKRLADVLNRVVA